MVMAARTRVAGAANGPVRPPGRRSNCSSGSLPLSCGHRRTTSSGCGQPRTRSAEARRAGSQRCPRHGSRRLPPPRPGPGGSGSGVALSGCRGRDRVGRGGPDLCPDRCRPGDERQTVRAEFVNGTKRSPQPHSLPAPLGLALRHRQRPRPRAAHAAWHTGRRPSPCHPLRQRGCRRHEGSADAPQRTQSSALPHGHPGGRGGRHQDEQGLRDQSRHTRVAREAASPLTVATACQPQQLRACDDQVKGVEDDRGRRSPQHPFRLIALPGYGAAPAFSQELVRHPGQHHENQQRDLKHGRRRLPHSSPPPSRTVVIDRTPTIHSLGSRLVESPEPGEPGRRWAGSPVCPILSPDPW